MIVYVTCWHISIRTYSTISLVVVLLLVLMMTTKSMRRKTMLMIFLKTNVRKKMHSPFPYP